MSTILITGGSGLIGSYLSEKLLNKGYQVSILSTSGKALPGTTTYLWHPEKNTIEGEAIETADYIIHLAGAGIGDKRWTGQRKKEIIDSRVKSCSIIFNQLKASKKELKAFISASAAGYYGMVTSDKIFTESDQPAHDFLGKTCQLWEQCAEQFSDLGIRTVKLRQGIVLTRKAGALAKMALPVKLGIGSAIGTGKQYLPWIHIDDLCSIYIKAIEDNQMIGAYNAVAPDHKTNEEFTKTMAQVLNKPFWFPHVPAFIMKLLFGEMAGVLLEGSRLSNEKITATGYKFKFTRLKDALNDLWN